MFKTSRPLVIKVMLGFGELRAAQNNDTDVVWRTDESDARAMVR